MTRSMLLVLAGIAAAVSVAATVIPRIHVSYSDAKSSPKSPELKLQRGFAAQLQRRFHDPKNVDFGFGRVYTPGARMHFTVLQNRNLTEAQQQLMERKRANEQSKHPGQILNASLEWVKPTKRMYVESFTPENSQERLLVIAAHQQKLEVSFYTAGRFEQTKFLRLKGPAYVQEPNSKPLTESQIGEWASSEYAKNAASYSGDLAGWKVYAERVFGTNEKCINCHNMSLSATGKTTKLLKKGDAIGLVVVAVKNR